MNFGGSNILGGQNARQTTQDCSTPYFNINEGIPNDTVQQLVWSPQGCPVLLLGAASWDGSVRIWRIDYQGKDTPPQAVPFMMKEAGAPVMSLSMSPTGQCFFGGMDRKLSLWDLQSGNVQQVGEHQLAVSSVVHMSNRIQTPLVVSGSWDGTVKIWDLRQAQPVKTENLGMPIMAMDGQKSSSQLQICTGRKTVTFDMSTGCITKETPISNLCKFGIRCVTNFQNGDCFAVGTSEGRVQVLSTAPNTSDYTCCFKGHYKDLGARKYIQYQINVVRQIPSVPSVLISGGGDGRFRVWRCSSKSRIYESEPVMFGNEEVPCTAGDVNADSTLVALAYGYDWSMGREGNNPNMPRSIHLVPVQPSWK